MRIDPATLRRRVQPLCTDCAIHPDAEQEELREERTRRDWKLLTDPIATGLLRRDEMPEQLPSTARAVLRAFFEMPDVETAVVPDCDAQTLNGSIASLGLSELMYAETRSQHTVLRRTPATHGSRG